jgi:Uma2 family endonuclease
MNAAVAKRFRWNVKRYFRLSEMGFFGDQRVELLNGEIIRMPAQAQPHRLAITRITRLMVPTFDPAKYTLVIQGTLPLSRYSAPDPDFHVIDAPEGTPEEQLSLPFLVIEVSDTTYLKDSGPKMRLYASSNIPEYWIVNLLKQQVEVYRRPENPTGKLADCRYGDVTVCRAGMNLSPPRSRGVAFPVDQMLASFHS